MRLIDADEVKKYILTEGFNCDTQADKEYVAELFTKLFKTVKAIPVEWIENYTRKHFTLDDWFGDVLSFMADMLEDWEKENE